VSQTNVIIKICPVLLFTLYNSKNIAHHITEVLIFYVDKIMVMGKSKNLHVFNFAILIKSRKSRKFDAREIYKFYSIISLSMTAVQKAVSCNYCYHISQSANNSLWPSLLLLCQMLSLNVPAC